MTRQIRSTTKRRAYPHEAWDVCDRCGFNYPVSQISKEAVTGYRVCPPCLDDPMTPHDGRDGER